MHIMGGADLCYAIAHIRDHSMQFDHILASWLVAIALNVICAFM